MTYDQRSDAAYLSRMRLIQRWRRMVNLICLFIVLYVGLLMSLDQSAGQHTFKLMIQSLTAFGVAAVTAVNLLTFLLRKPSAKGTFNSAVGHDG